MAYKHDDKSSGQLIRSADWNDMGHEIERLEADKVNRGGDTIKGDLTVTGKAQLGSLGVTGDASITGKVQFGPLTVSGDVSVSGKAQLGSLGVTGDASITGSLSFGAQVRQMINLWSTHYGIGIQAGTQYFRTDYNFAWYKGGSHNDNELNPGGGAIQMVIRDSNVGIGVLDPQNKLDVNGNHKVMGDRIKSADDLGIVQTNAKDRLRINPDSHYPSIALYNPVAIGTGGLSIGDWSQMPQGQLKVTGQAQFGSVMWGNGSILTPDQGGSIELGGNHSTKGVGVPYIDFHFSGLTEDFNTRIINDGNKQLSIYGNLNVNGTFTVNSPSGNKLIMQGDGNLVIYRPNGTAWWNTQTNISDSRLKKNIHSIERPLEKLLSVKGISFSWAKEEWGSERELGVLADEVERVFPELVYSLDKKYKSVKYQGLIAVLIEAIKEQQTIIQQFGAEIQNLKGMLKLNPA